MLIVATAGQVGHGKSALIHALTGVQPDGGPADAQRGGTAEPGFAWLTLPSGAQLGLVDAGGPERFIASVLAGAAPVPAVLFIVAADQGWMPQSAEHLAVVSALGVSQALLVVTKSDLADPGPALAEAAARIAGSPLGAVPAVAVSSATSAGVPDLVAALDQWCAGQPAPDPGAAVRIWIDRSFSVAGGTVVTGTLPAGTVHKDDQLLLTPGMRPVRVRELQVLGKPVDAAAGPTRVALHLAGVSRDTLHRGTALVSPGRWTLTDVLDVRIGAVSPPPAADGEGAAGEPGAGTAAPGQLGRSVALHVGSARVIARVRPLGPGLARLGLADPLPVHVGDRLLLRDPGTRRPDWWPPVSGAVVLDVAPPPLARRGAAAAAARQLASWPDRPTAAELLARHGLLRGSALLAMGVPELPEPVTGEWLADPDRWRALSHQLGEVLASHAAAEPLAAGLPIEVAREALDLPDRRLVTALARPPFRISCGAVQIGLGGSTAGPKLPESAQAAIQVLRADLAAAPFASPDASRLRKLGLDARSIAVAVRAGELLRISDQVVLAPGADEAAAAILSGLDQPFTAAEARQALGTTRRTAIPLLEFLDAAGITERLADDRRVLRATVGRDGAAAPARVPDASVAADATAATAAVDG